MPYTHLTENERYVISHLSVAGYPLREIARRIKETNGKPMGTSVNK
ncbi:MAG: helix-turn-helix domain-containing protein [Thermodesulfobacteriota bacterium]|nr:helix-turn-helix domain-containing protein [Thermodesulfobacteriota bacterium]